MKISQAIYLLLICSVFETGVIKHNKNSQHHLPKNYYSNLNVQKRHHKLKSNIPLKTLQKTFKRYSFKEASAHNKMKTKKLYNKYKRLEKHIEKRKQMIQQHKKLSVNQIYAQRHNLLQKQFKDIKTDKRFYKKVGSQKTNGPWNALNKLGMKKSLYKHIPTERKLNQKQEKKLENILDQFKSLFNKSKKTSVKKMDKKLKNMRLLQEEFLDQIELENQDLRLLDQRERELIEENEELEQIPPVQESSLKVVEEQPMENERFLTKKGFLILINFNPRNPILFKDFLKGYIKATDPRPIVKTEYDLSKSIDYLEITLQQLTKCFNRLREKKLHFNYWSQHEETKNCLTDYYYQMQVMRNIFLQIKIWLHEIWPQKINFQNSLYDQKDFYYQFVDNIGLDDKLYVKTIFKQIDIKRYLEIYKENAQSIFRLMKLSLQYQDFIIVDKFANLSNQPHFKTFLNEFHNQMVYFVYILQEYVNESHHDQPQNIITIVKTLGTRKNKNDLVLNETGPKLIAPNPENEYATQIFGDLVLNTPELKHHNLIINRQLDDTDEQVKQLQEKWSQEMNSLTQTVEKYNEEINEKNKEQFIM